MPIIVEKAERYRTCGCCESQEDVASITFIRKVGNTNMGTQVALCASCAKELVSMLGYPAEPESHKDDQCPG